MSESPRSHASVPSFVKAQHIAGSAGGDGPAWTGTA